MDEIRASLDILIQSGTPKSQITVLHCTSSYPASMSEVNLLAMTRMRKELDTVVGYSDHTLGSEVAIAAVALGASTIEKHITLDKESSGPDHHASLSPSELRTMIYQIRNIELALGNDLKQCTESEIEIASIARKSIVARKSIKAGETFSEENLTTKRPGTGISPMRWDKLIGSRASRNYEIDEMICEA
jgi:N,N'-diacetyllegionaminate synthase